MRNKIKIKRYVFAGLAIILIICTFVFCQGEKKPVQEHARLPYKNLSDSAHFVGMNTCMQCHQGIHETFIHTGMGQSFDIASRKKSSARFDRHALIYDKYSDFYYKPLWSGDTLKIMEFRLEGRDTIHKRVERVDYIIGSGQHTNSHMMNINGYIYQAPMTFYTQKGKWDLPPGFENGVNTRFSRAIELECMSCHNSYPGFVKGSVNKYTEVPSGISCERCHGAGSIHVSEKRAGKIVDISKEIDYSIVNPAKLPVDLQFEICQRCHLQGNTVLNEGMSFFDFKPGMRLSEVMNVFVPRQAGSDEFIMASHVERMKMSPCFTETMKKLENGTLAVGDKLRPYKNAMTCVTCHNPHISVKVTGEEVFNTACRNCHGSAEKAHTICSRKTEDPSSGDCVSCHMPKSTTLDIPHVIATDHYIRKPSDRREVEKIKKFLGIQCVNNPDPEKIIVARGYIQYYEKFNGDRSSLDSAEKYLSGPLTVKNLSAWVHLFYLRKDFEKLIAAVEKVGIRNILKDQRQEWSNEDAYMDYRIGDAYFILGKNEEAEKYLSTACRLAPFNPDFLNRYGALLMKLGKTEEAFRVFSDIVKENPRHVPALCNLGYLYLVLNNDVQKANELYDASLKLDPDYEQGLLNKAGLLLSLSKYREAEKYLKRLIKKHPENRSAKELLIKLNSIL